MKTDCIVCYDKHHCIGKLPFITVEHEVQYEVVKRFVPFRICPVLVTTLAGILGMLPLALAISAGAELLQPLAIAVIGELAVALLFSLIFTPTVYYIQKK